MVYFLEKQEYDYRGGSEVLRHCSRFGGVNILFYSDLYHKIFNPNDKESFNYSQNKHHRVLSSTSQDARP